MTVGRGRIVRASEAPSAKRVLPAVREEARVRIARAEADALAAAKKIVAAAKERAGAVIAHAEMQAQLAAEKAAREAAKAEETKLAAAWLALRTREESRAAGDLDRAIALAVALAERLVGASLELRPDTIADLARQALAQARGARRALIEAHPDDASMLGDRLASLGLDPSAIEVRPNLELARGELCLHTDIGTLDAKLKPQLERLAAALRDALR